TAPTNVRPPTGGRPAHRYGAARRLPPSTDVGPPGGHPHRCRGDRRSPAPHTDRCGAARRSPPHTDVGSPGGPPTDVGATGGRPPRRWRGDRSSPPTIHPGKRSKNDTSPPSRAIRPAHVSAAWRSCKKSRNSRAIFWRSGERDSIKLSSTSPSPGFFARKTRDSSEAASST